MELIIQIAHCTVKVQPFSLMSVEVIKQRTVTSLPELDSITNMNILGPQPPVLIICRSHQPSYSPDVGNMKLDQDIKSI